MNQSRLCRPAPLSAFSTSRIRLLARTITRAPGSFRIVFAGALIHFTIPASASEGFFTPPESPFLTNPTEKIRVLALPAGPVETAQALVNGARQASSDAVLVLHVSGQLLASSAPLRLGSRMCLVFDSGASITATVDATARFHLRSLLQIDGAESVSISSRGAERGLVDGGGNLLTGIAVSKSGKVNIDGLLIRRCGGSAISYTGRSADALNDAGSVTRCRIEHCDTGLDASTTAGFSCLDNEFRLNRGPAIVVGSSRSIVAGNLLIENQTGLVSACDHGVVARNTFDGNATSLELTATSAGNLIAENRSLGKVAALKIGGHHNQFYGNDLQESVWALSGAEHNLLAANIRLDVGTSEPQSEFFDPPTFGNPHQHREIVPGLGRFDLAISGSSDKTEPTDLAAVRDGLIKARAEHPRDVIVLHLDGYYVSRTPEGLELPANTCAILNGCIRADLGTPPDPVYRKAEPISQVVRLAPDGYCSISGGTLDGGRQAFHGVNASGSSTAIIDHVDIRGSARDGIYTKGRGGEHPLFIHACTVSANGGRGIWMHVAGRVHVLDNVCAGNNQDGIDVDAHANDCTILFNVAAGNRRHGVFVEEGVTHNVVFGNQLSGNLRSGIHVWNEAVAGNTGENVISANVCRDNAKGVSVGGRAADKTANQNLFFNNVCLGNRDFGLSPGNSHAVGNFFSQSVIHGNGGQQVGTLGPDLFFFASPDSK